MTTFGKISLASLGVILFWTAFVGGLDTLGRGNPSGMVGPALFIAIPVALTIERFRIFLTAATSAKAYPARFFVTCVLLMLVFLPTTISAANDPLTLTNAHLIRRLIYAGVAASLSALALVVNGVTYFIARP